MYLWVTEEQGTNAVCFAVPRPTLARHKATIAFASDESKASAPAAQHAEDDEDAASASQLAMQLRGGSHDYPICLVCLGTVSWRSSQTAHVLVDAQQHPYSFKGYSSSAQPQMSHGDLQAGNLGPGPAKRGCRASRRAP